MKKYIFASMACLALFAACDDDYIDQFNIETGVTDVKEVAMTLSNSDYTTIAGNSVNKEIALALDPETESGLAALEEVGKKRYFTADAPADLYLPAFLASKYPNADLNSKFTVTYNEYQAPATYLADFANISTYTLTSDDYENVWGDKVKASFLSPESVGKIPAILAENVEAAEGDMMVVNYAYSETEPSIGGGAAPLVYKQVSEIPGEGNYVIAALADDGNYYPFAKLDNETKGYGYIYPDPIVVTDGIILEADAKDYVVSLAAMGDNYSILNNWGQYVYNAGTYQNFNFGSMPSDHEGWTITPNADGKTFSMISSANGNYTKLTMYNNSYSYGCYPQSKWGGNTYLDASFADADNIGGFEIKDVALPDGSTYVWKLDSYGYYKASAYIKGNKASESWLVSAEIDLSSASTPQLTFDEAINYLNKNDVNEFCTIQISTDYTGDVTAATWTALEVPTRASGSSWSFVNSGAVDLSAYKGEKVFIAFKYVSTTSCATTWEIKNVLVADAPKDNYWDVCIFQEMEESEAAAPAMASTRASVEANEAALYRYDGSAWAVYTNKDAQVAVVKPGEFSSASSDATTADLLPMYLAKYYPYALEGEAVVVVYNEKATEYTKAAEGWIETPASAPQTMTFTKDEDGITAKISVYLESSLMGTDGGFTAQDVKLTGGLSYIWTNTSSYGWKASSFLNSTNNPAESWLVSPALDFRKGTAPQVTFDEAINYIKDADKNVYCAVKISTDYKGDVTTATWTDLELPVRADGASWNFVNVGVVDLSAYVGNVARLAFVYYVPDESPVGPTWEFKNILVNEKE